MKVSPNTERILYNVIWNRQWNPSTILFVLWCPWRVDYTESKKGTLQGLVVGRWVQCDHILLINLRSKTLRLRNVEAVWTTKARKEVKETIQILSVNTILFTYRRCSIWPPPIFCVLPDYVMRNSWKDDNFKRKNLCLSRDSNQISSSPYWRLNQFAHWDTLTD